MKYCMTVGLMVALAGCVTVAGVFNDIRPDYTGVPEDALKLTAMQIEAAVAAGERTPVLAEANGLVAETEPIRQAIRTRAVRRPLVDELLEAGHAVQQRNGLISAQLTREYTKATSRQERNRHSLIILSENNDRWAIYEGIQKANNFRPGALGAVRDAFYQAQVAHLGSGQHYEARDGTQMRK